MVGAPSEDDALDELDCMIPEGEGASEEGGWKIEFGDAGDGQVTVSGRMNGSSSNIATPRSAQSSIFSSNRSRGYKHMII